MCRWGCTTNHTTYMCKWCGTRYCRECLRGDFHGLMSEPSKCRKCNHMKCQGVRVEYVPSANQDEEDKGNSKSRSRSKSPAKSTRSAKSAKSSTNKKSAKKSGKKSGAKKKKRK